MAQQVRSARLDTATAWAGVNAGPIVWTRSGRRGMFSATRGCVAASALRSRGAVRKRRLQESLGAANDILDANGETVLSWPQAQEKARAFFERGERSGKHVGSVRQRLVEYFKDRRIHKTQGGRERSAICQRAHPRAARRPRGWCGYPAATAGMAQPLFGADIRGADAQSRQIIFVAQGEADGFDFRGRAGAEVGDGALRTRRVRGGARPVRAVS
jgi:hypothetical protein